MAAETDGGSGRGVDEEGLFVGGVEGDAKMGGNVGKGENVGDGGRVVPDGDGDVEHTEGAFGVGGDGPTAVGTHGEGAGSARGKVGEESGVFEEAMGGTAVHKDAARWEDAGNGGKASAVVGALGGVVAGGLAVVAGDGSVKDAVSASNAGSALCK